MNSAVIVGNVNLVALFGYEWRGPRRLVCKL